MLPAVDVLIYLKKLNRECALVKPSRAEVSNIKSKQHSIH